MSRRLVFILALVALAIAAIAIFPWTLTSSGPASMLTRQLHDDYDLDLHIGGKSTFALLPTPRIKVENVGIKGLDGRLQITAATLHGSLNFLPLLSGRIEFADVAIANASTALDLTDAGDGFWASWVAWLQRHGGASSIRQLAIADSSLTIRRDRHSDIVFTSIDAALNWPKNSDSLSVSGDFDWNGRTISVTRADILPAVVLSGRSSPFTLDMSLSDSQLALTGTIRFDKSRNVVVAGTSAVQTRSLRQLADWAGLPVPLAPLIEAFSLEGDFATARNIVSWPSIRIGLGESRLEGSLSFRFGPGNQTVSGTLATEAIDLTPFVTPLGRVFADRAATLSIADINRADLDLRLSANTCRIGKVAFSDMALGILISEERFEASLGRISLDRGTIKGRLLMTGPATARDLKLQGSFDGVNLSRLAANLDKSPVLTGTAQGQISLDGSGTTLAGILGDGHGKLSLAVTNGEIRGLDIPGMLEQAATQASSRDSGQEIGQDSSHQIPFKEGITPFELAHLAMIVESGTGFITDGAIRTDGEATTLNGDVSFAERTLAINALAALTGSNGNSELAITASGHWDAPSLAARVQEKPKPPQEAAPVEPEVFPLPPASHAE